MFVPMIGRRGLAAFAAAALLAGCAREPAVAQTPAAPARQVAAVAAKPATPTRVSTPACDKARPVTGPLEPLVTVTPTGRTAFSVELADDDAERERGLMCRRVLAPDRGMLFDFRTPRDVAFWMKNTLIPLDIIYIRADGRVLSIARDATPLDETPLPSGGEIRGVLELAGGRAAQIGLLPGDRIEHRIFPHG